MLSLWRSDTLKTQKSTSILVCCPVTCLEVVKLSLNLVYCLVTRFVTGVMRWRHCLVDCVEHRPHLPSPPLATHSSSSSEQTFPKVAVDLVPPGHQVICLSFCLPVWVAAFLPVCLFASLSALWVCHVVYISFFICSDSLALKPSQTLPPGFRMLSGTLWENVISQQPFADALNLTF